MGSRGPEDDDTEPKSVEELEAELEKVKGDIEHAKAESDAPDLFDHPEEGTYEGYFNGEDKEKRDQ